LVRIKERGDRFLGSLIREGETFEIRLKKSADLKLKPGLIRSGWHRPVRTVNKGLSNALRRMDSCADEDSSQLIGGVAIPRKSISLSKKS
jgi:hypothetical protein